MNYINFKSQYDRFPSTKVRGFDSSIFTGSKAILDELSNIKNGVIAIECYPGVNMKELSSLLSKLTPHLYNIEDCTIGITQINEMIKRNVTEDRVFGLMSHHTIDEFYDFNKINQLKSKLVGQGLHIVYGFGASLIKDFNQLIYVSLARWEIQLRYRKGMPNWLMDNDEEDNLRKYKRAFFIEWRVADRLKKEIIDQVNYVVDYNQEDCPKMITKQAYDAGLQATINKPFRTVPYFDPGVWGGQWMKEVCNLDNEKSNYAWSFDGVPEENSLYLNYNGVNFEIPSIDLVFFQSQKLLGPKVIARFGKEFPIRFDFLDTMEGGNLSLQVHPLTDYIFDQFGMKYTQDESYYFLDAKEDAKVYVGVKEGVNKEEMFRDLRRAEKGEISFDDSKYINCFPVKKHDHVLIPAGTVHASGTNAMVLEISSTPYIFTFKMWDWDRLGLDGVPRPVHIDHGEKNIQMDRDTKWVKENLINNFRKISDIETATGLHEYQFIETRRFFFEDKIELHTKDSVNMLNLVEGKVALVESPSSAFEPFEVHYAETFIVPEHLGVYTIKSVDGEKCGVIQAYVRC